MSVTLTSFQWLYISPQVVNSVQALGCDTLHVFTQKNTTMGQIDKSIKLFRDADHFRPYDTDTGTMDTTKPGVLSGI